MDALIDSLDTDKWQTIDAQAKGDGYKEFRVMRAKKAEEVGGTLKLSFIDEKDDPKTFLLEGCKKGKNPLKEISLCELKVQDDKIVGISTDDDAVSVIA